LSGSGLTPGGQGFLAIGSAFKQGSDAKKRGGDGRWRCPNQKDERQIVAFRLSLIDEKVATDSTTSCPADGQEKRSNSTSFVSQDDKQDIVAAWQLCYERCLAVMNFLTQKGIDRSFRLARPVPEPQVTASRFGVGLAGQSHHAQ
jgi:hypothetical protein